MSKLIALTNTMTEIKEITGVSSCEKTEEINGENTITFSMILSDDNKNLINSTNAIGIGGDYYDIIHYRKEQTSNGDLAVQVDCEHISYRLNDPELDVEFFTASGSSSSILSKILLLTGFTVGTIISGTTVFSLQEKSSRRSILMQFADHLGGELLFEGFSVSIVAARGSTTPKNLMQDRNIDVVSIDVDKANLDSEGNPTIAYECSLIEPMELALGDKVTIDYDSLGIDITLRIVRITTDPYNNAVISFSISNTVPSIETSAYKTEFNMLTKDKFYNGTRIGPENGFEAVRSDNMARAYFRSDEMKFQSGDGSGTTWKDRLYYAYNAETDETTLIFDGNLSADIIEAITAIVAPNLYADKAYIAQLTVDQLNSSDKVKKYLDNDTTDDNFVKIYDQYVELVTAAIPGKQAVLFASSSWDLAYGDQADDYFVSAYVNAATGIINYSNGATMNAYEAYTSGYIYRAKNSTSFYKITGYNETGIVYYEEYHVELVEVNEEQATDRNGDPLFWTDATKTIASTTETEWPVMVYEYEESVKMRLGFKEEPSSGYYMPVIELGAGTGAGDSGRGYIYKGTSGLYIDYYSAADGSLRRVLLGDDGVIITPYALESIDFYTDGFSARYSGQDVTFSWETDENGVITELTTADYEHIPVTWHEEGM